MRSAFPDRQEVLFGRESDLLYLMRRAELSGITLIAGRAQMGKTWLLTELARRLASRWIKSAYRAKSQGDLEELTREANEYRFRELDDLLPKLTQAQRKLAIRIALLPLAGEPLDGNICGK